MGYSAKPCPIPRCPIEAAFLLASCLLLLFEQIGEIDDPFTKSRRLAGLTYAFPMAYVFEDGTSYERIYQFPTSRLGGVVGTLVCPDKRCVSKRW